LDSFSTAAGTASYDHGLWEQGHRLDVTDAMSANNPTETPADRIEVLVIEDDVLIRLDMADSLRVSGFTVLEASNGDEALTVLKAVDTVALVVSDIQMPGKIDGLALAAWLRREMPHIAIVLVTGRLPAAGMSTKADAVLGKPTDTTLLVEKVRHLLGNR
jgi:CheY-like chemotaxis protein